MSTRTVALRSLLAYILAPALLFLALDAMFGTDWMVEHLARYRPTSGESTLEVNVARQMLGMDAALRASLNKARVAVVGSSSVVNGIDVEVIAATWAGTRVEATPFNFGHTGLMAYELPLLKRYLLAPGIDRVVYLYNTFSFGNRLLGTVIGVRWDTGEMSVLQPFEPREPDSCRRYTVGAMTERLTLMRYGNVLRTIVTRAVRGALRPLPYFPDSPPEAEPNAVRPRQLEPVAPDSHWLRAAYLDSQREPGSLGYRGLLRFFDLARSHNVTVIVMPVPEPEFGLYTRWRQGIDAEAIDQRVAALCEQAGVTFVPRERFADLERDDTLFLDPTHFNRFGRTIYSRRLAELLEALPK